MLRRVQLGPPAQPCLFSSVSFPIPHPPSLPPSVVWRPEGHPATGCLLSSPCRPFWSVAFLPGFLEEDCFYACDPGGVGAWLGCCGLACSPDYFSLIERKECAECGETAGRGLSSPSGMQILDFEMGRVADSQLNLHSLCPFWAP